MKTLREEMTDIITKNSPERAALEILAMLEDRGLSLVNNGWLDDDEDAITQIEKIVEDRAYSRFADIPIGTFYIHGGFNRKVSETEARKVDFHKPETFIDEEPSQISPDLRVFPARGLN